MSVWITGRHGGSTSRLTKRRDCEAEDFPDDTLERTFSALNGSEPGCGPYGGGSPDEAAAWFLASGCCC